jgi:hypothetical protein
VQGGSYPANDPRRDAVTIFGDPKSGSAPVTFACASSQTVDVAAGWFTIKAFDVDVVGGCFRLHSLRVGEPGDRTVTAQNVTVDGVHMQGLEVVGGRQVTVRNSEVGPNVYCYAQGTSGAGDNGGPITPAMWCDPSGPAYEAYWAGKGNVGHPFQPYIHNNAGGVNPTFTLDSSHVHDLQTKDAVNLHTGCGLIWTIPGAGANSVVFRGNRFENCAVLGLLFEYADGVTITDNWFGYPVEPLSNGRGAQVETDLAQREISLKTAQDWQPRNWMIAFNSFSHGISLDNSRISPQYSNVVVRANLLGRYSYCPAGVVFVDNVFEGKRCGQDLVPIPFGYKLAEHRIETEGKKAVIVRKVFAAAASGKGLVEIARQLRRSKQINRNARWVKRVVADEFYLGAQVGPRGAHPALVTKAVWRRAQRAASG